MWKRVVLGAFGLSTTLIGGMEGSIGHAGCRLGKCPMVNVRCLESCLSGFSPSPKGWVGEKSGLLLIAGGAGERNEFSFRYSNNDAKNHQRTSASLVGSVMALLAVFDEAGELPAEGTSQANQLIHALIQLQSVMIKSQSPEVQGYLSMALHQDFAQEQEKRSQAFHKRGLTSQVLEALLQFSHTQSPWKQPPLAEEFHRYNLTRSDWEFMDHIYSQALESYRKKGVSLHDAFDRWRAKMPGGRSE